MLGINSSRITPFFRTGQSHREANCTRRALAAWRLCILCNLWLVVGYNGRALELDIGSYLDIEGTIEAAWGTSRGGRISPPPSHHAALYVPPTSSTPSTLKLPPFFYSPQPCHTTCRLAHALRPACDLNLRGASPSRTEIPRCPQHLFSRCQPLLIGWLAVCYGCPPSSCQVFQILMQLAGAVEDGREHELELRRESEKRFHY